MRRASRLLTCAVGGGIVLAVTPARVTPPCVVPPETRIVLVDFDFAIPVIS